MNKIKYLIIGFLIGVFLFISFSIGASLVGPDSGGSPSIPGALCLIDGDTWVFCDPLNTFGDAGESIYSITATTLTDGTLTITGGDLTTTGTGTFGNLTAQIKLVTDHIGEYTVGHNVVFDNPLSFGSNLINITNNGTNKNVQIGYNASATSELGGVAIGESASASGRQSTVIGIGTSADGWYSTAIGSGASTDGYASTAIGDLASASGDWSIAIGYGASAPYSNQIVLSTTDGYANPEKQLDIYQTLFPTVQHIADFQFNKLIAQSIDLEATSNQIVLQSAGITTTLTESGATSNKVITFPNATGTVALTSDLASYLPLGGGTMTGAIAMGGNNITGAGAITGTSLTASGLTSGRVPIIGTGGLLGDDADLTFDGTKLTSALFATPSETLGNELVTNGSFTSETGWNWGDGWSLSGGTAYFLGDYTYNGSLIQTIGITAGNWYKLSVQVTSIGAGGVYITCGGWSSGKITGIDTFVYYFKAANTNALTFLPDSEDDEFNIDNVSVKQVTAGIMDAARIFATEFQPIVIGNKDKYWVYGDLSSKAYALAVYSAENTSGVPIVAIMPNSVGPYGTGITKFVLGWDNPNGGGFDLGDYMFIGNDGPGNLFFTTYNGSGYATRFTLGNGAPSVNATWRQGVKQVHTPSSTQGITAVGNTILADSTMIVLNPNGDYTLTSAPTIANGTTGQILYITCANGEANTVTVQDQDTLPSSNLQLGAATRAISGRDVLQLMFDGADWIEVSYGNN